MWNLKPLQVENYREHVDLAFPLGGSQGVSEADKDQLLEFYKLYEQKLGRPSPELIGKDIRPALQRSVHDAYDLVQDGRRLGALRSALKLLAESCPYCGFAPIEQLDHLLQKGEYKLFSIFPLNLVPSCGSCNNGKPKTPSANQNEHQIHVYLEDISGYEFLRAEVNLDPATGGMQTRYFVEHSAGMPEDLYYRLVHHLKEFDLQTKYNKQINIFLGELEYSITSSFEDGGPEALKKWLTGNVGALTRRFGSNDWRTALMRGLSEYDAFYQGGFKSALGIKPSP